MVTPQRAGELPVHGETREQRPQGPGNGSLDFIGRRGLTALTVLSAWMSVCIYSSSRGRSRVLNIYGEGTGPKTAEHVLVKHYATRDRGSNSSH